MKTRLLHVLTVLAFGCLTLSSCDFIQIVDPDVPTDQEQKQDDEEHEEEEKHEEEKRDDEEEDDDDSTLDGYYEGIKPSSSSLVEDLYSLNSKKRARTVGYKNMPSYYTKTDKGTSSGEVIAFYAGTSDKYSGNMNKEHVWPNSLGGSSVENDIHMPRPTYSDDNGSRGNEYYVEGKRGPAKPYNETGWDPGAFQGQDETYRGDSARIIFYCCIANTNLKLVDTNGDSKPANTMGKLSDLLKWNLKYPVLQREKDRNDAIEGIQGNRNPFIDHPEFACKIWGNYNSATKSICGGNY